MELVTLQSDAVQVQVLPKFGARVTALIDRRSGRDWLVGGAPAGDTGETAVYLGEQARGWDECFPTVAPCASPDWGRNLRDHGDLWGRPWEIEESGPIHLTCAYAADGYTFRRTLTLEDDTLRATYSVRGQARPYLYSQHMLLVTNPGERIVLDGIGPLSGGGKTLDWPGGSETIAGIETGLASKAYGPATGRASAGVLGRDGAIMLTWDAAEMPYFGLWRCYGGWPDAEIPVHQLALEPTTAPADDLAQASAQGLARVINPNTEHSWTIDIALSQAGRRAHSPQEAQT